MSVMIDRNRHTAIVISRGTKWIHIVELGEGPLTLSRISEDQIKERGFKPLENYPLEKAVGLYLQHNGGVSDAARRELSRLLET